MKAIGDYIERAIDYIKRNWLTLLFIALYTLVTVATLRHSAAGFASLEGGSMWWGYLSALAVDAGMALSATSLRKRLTLWPFVGLLVSAAASTFTQLLYAVANAAVMPVSPGAQWLGPTAQSIADMRVVILPALLPLLSVVYSFSSKSVPDVDAPDIADLRADIEQYQTKLEQAQDIARQWQKQAEQALSASALLAALPQQTQAELYSALASGNGKSASQVAQVLGISLHSARRGVQTRARKGVNDE